MAYAARVPQRRFREITARELTFRFYYDIDDPDVLHIVKRWGVDPRTAISVFFGPTEPIWVDWRRCWETRTERYTLAWLWLTQEERKVLVITCVDSERALE